MGERGDSGKEFTAQEDILRICNAKQLIGSGWEESATLRESLACRMGCGEE